MDLTHFLQREEQEKHELWECFQREAGLEVSEMQMKWSEYKMELQQLAIQDDVLWTQL